MNEVNKHDAASAADASFVAHGVSDPPTKFVGILKQLGPGLIIAGSIVGSGELIATTKTGAQAGISFLWLIIIGCVIKVFVQIELGRYTVTHGETTLAALNRVPGPRLIVNWIVWYWLLMVLVGLFQVGGIVGGVGQSLALACPINGDYARAIEVPSESELKHYVGWDEDDQNGRVEFAKLSKDDQDRLNRGQDIIKARIQKLDQGKDKRGTEALVAVKRLIAAEREGELTKASDADDSAVTAAEVKVKTEKDHVKRLLEPTTRDDKYWALAVTLVTIAILFRGRYGLIQTIATALVVTFTFITIGNVISLQLQPDFRLSGAELLQGLKFGFPDQTPAPPGIVGWAVKNPLATALSTFGIIGVGASELVMYPYWCLEKGYAKFTGPRSEEQSWANRARGWMMVMHYDAFASMVIYTIATLAFFVMGVAVMYQQGLDPSGMRMVSMLLEQYVPVFGANAKWLFLFGAIAVLYSTFLVASAGLARVFTDALKVYGLLDPHNQKAHDRWLSFFCVLLPSISLGTFWSGVDPVAAVLLGGTMQAIMLPMLAFAALYFRYRLTDRRLQPGRLWDALLMLSCIGLVIAGAWKAYGEMAKFF